MAALSETWLDRTIGTVAPRWHLKRMRARVAADLVKRHYEAAGTGRRTNWNRTGGDANSAVGASIGKIRDLSRDFVRNNAHARGALRTIGNHVVGWGIVANATPSNKQVDDRWRQWAGTTACDADGRRNLPGLQKLIIRGVAESGEMLVRRRWRRPSDGLPIPLQLQVLEPDHLDTNKTQLLEQGRGRIVNGIEYDPIGTRVAYWLFPEHPGSTLIPGGSFLSASRRVPAAEILHVFEADRAGQNRAISWFAPILLPAKDLDEYCDAQVMKQKIAACLAIVTSDVDGTGTPLGTSAAGDTSTSPETDQLQPGGILNLAPGRAVTVVDPPTVGDYEAFTSTEHRKIAKGLGLSYEDYTGDYSKVNFSSARMSRIEHYENVHDWRWQLLVPQFCDRVFEWAMTALQLQGTLETLPTAEWTAPPMPMIEPDKEGLAYQRLMRNGLMSLAEALRERGDDPQAVLSEIATMNAVLDTLGVKLDSDPRHMTQAGQQQGTPSAPAAPAAPAKDNPDAEGDTP